MKMHSIENAQEYLGGRKRISRRAMAIENGYVEVFGNGM
jgi:hypothetical protein